MAELQQICAIQWNDFSMANILVSEVALQKQQATNLIETTVSQVLWADHVP